MEIRLSSKTASDDHQMLSAGARSAQLDSLLPIVAAVQGVVDPSLLFPPDADRVDRSGTAPAGHAHHHEQFATEIWRPAPDISPEELADRLRARDLLRAKGFARTSAGLRLVQLVGRRVELHEVDAEPPPSLIGQIVLIRRA